MRFACHKKEKCKRCGQCCYFRESLDLTKDEEDQIKRKLFEKTGVIYLYPFDRYTISITEKEKQLLEKRAQEKNIKIKFIPKRIFINYQNQVQILDWSIDHDVCPFYIDHACSIYPDRPLVCQKFPKKYELPFDKSIKKTPWDYNQAQKLAHNFIKKK